MTVQMITLWELLLDGIQIFLCAVILFFLIYNKIKHKRLILNTSAKENTADFSNEMRLQNLQQVAENAFDAIVDDINRQRLSLMRHFVSNESDHLAGDYILPVAVESGSDQPEDYKNEEDTAEFGEIFGLAEKGLSTREISQRLNMPRGEVELVLRLNKEVFSDKSRGNIKTVF